MSSTPAGAGVWSLRLAPFRGHLTRGYSAMARGWEQHPWVSYTTLALLQLKMSWGAWRYLDLAAGDTASYFLYARLWLDGLRVNLVWSPLYTVFYGTVLYLLDDVYVATVWHRLVIVFVIGALVLTVLRRLLPSALAWCLAAWYVVVPLSLPAYEIHLFSVLPFLVVWLVVLRRCDPWGRGCALAMLLLATVLLRNEMIVATLAFGGLCLVWEMRSRRRSHPPSPSRRVAVVLAYGLPMSLAIALCLLSHSRSISQYPYLTAYYATKHRLNMCQVYAFGYKQRHPEWTKNHWTECEELMTAHFGKKQPSLLGMLKANPREVLEHVWWNVSLAPAGIQLLLFGAISGQVPPDYGEVPSGSSAAFVLLLLVGLTILTGLSVLCRKHSRPWNAWSEERMFGWLTIVSTVLPMSALVIAIQRPRPEYLHGLGILLIALVAQSIWVIAGDRFATRGVGGGMWVIVIIALWAASWPYVGPQPPRPLLELYRRLSPFQKLIADPGAVVVVSDYPFEVSNYLGGFAPPRVLDYAGIGLPGSGERVGPLLDQEGASLFYVNERLIDQIGRNCFATAASGVCGRWTLIAYEDGGGVRWRLWGRSRE